MESAEDIILKKEQRQSKLELEQLKKAAEREKRKDEWEKVKTLSKSKQKDYKARQEVSIYILTVF
jgi:hypothetical protein